MSNELAIAMTTGEIIAQKRTIQEAMQAVMKKDVHYGIIPGCPKPSLYQAGAEVLATTFHLALDPHVEDMSTPPTEFRYRVTTNVMTSSGGFVGAAVGEASTAETKYAWRAAVCQEEWDETLDDKRRKLFKKAGDGHTIILQVRTNPADLANTVLKMATKRANVAAIRQCTAASDIFAQDVEDLQDVADIDAGILRVPPPIQKPRATESVRGKTEDGGEWAIGTVDECTEKKGETNGKPWACFFVTINGEKYATFDTEIAALTQPGQTIRYTWKQGAKGKVLTAAVPCSEAAE